MSFSKISIVLAPFAMLLPAPVLAMPDTAEELRAVIENDFGGDPNAYVSEESGDFRRMACRGRADLIETLFDEGLEPRKVSLDTYSQAASCAWNENELAAMRLLFSPDYIAAVENSKLGEKNRPTLLFNRIYADDYQRVRHLLENGVHYFRYDQQWQGLSREEQLLLAADYASGAGKENAVRAFRDSGFGYILDAAARKENVRYVEERAGRGGGAGGGLLGALAGGVLGTYIGGGVGAGAGLLMGATSGDDSEEAAATPLELATGRVDLGLQLDQVELPEGGLRIVAIDENGPAQVAGLLLGDIITQIAGVPVNSRGSYYVATEKANGLDTFEISFRRDGGEQAVQFDPLARVMAAEQNQEVQTADGTGEGRLPTSEIHSVLAELERLGNLRDRGILSQEEFEEMKNRILKGP